MKDFIDINDPNTVVLFFKLLKKTDLEHQLIVPTEVLTKYPVLGPNGQVSESIISVDKNEKRWEFRLAIRKNDNHPKPTIPPASWHPFVEEYGLRAGDAVLFYTRLDDAPDRIQVRGLRKAILFMGKESWVEVEKVHNQA
ncbi:hypothetical protein P3X46_013306 [Hevea brasiliensis]|uniref:TF-B3 domain-containing protein n=1 Tax=Hevea brasiliensis TaxID=3981 RepID=A0ABQ9M586_HEVBR|nr:hypothetical protein P3X46_013306 [Hevea brasiliensis]